MSERGTPQGFDRLPSAPLVTPVEPPPSRWTMPTDGPVDDSDLVALGADLEPGTLLSAYRAGLFPMPFDRRRIAWFSPDPRGIIPLDGLRVSRSLRRSTRRYEVRMNTRFGDVMEACADPSRHGGWINRAFTDAYTRLNELGWAHSVEIYASAGSDNPDSDNPDSDNPDSDNPGGALVGGLYGVRVGGLFAGESMFHRSTDASKVALVHLVDWLLATGGELLDVQWTTPHLVSLGAIDIPRVEYLKRLTAATG